MLVFQNTQKQNTLSVSGWNADQLFFETENLAILDVIDIAELRDYLSSWLAKKGQQ